MKATVSVLTALVIALGLGACNTVSGIGQDISAASDGVKKEITKEPKDAN